LKKLTIKYKQSFNSVTFENNKGALVVLKTKDIEIRIKSPPDYKNVNYFNLELNVAVKEGVFNFTAFDYDYEYLNFAVEMLDSIILAVIEKNYRIGKQKIIWKWVNTYMYIDTIHGERALLRISKPSI